MSDGGHNRQFTKRQAPFSPTCKTRTRQAESLLLDFNFRTQESKSIKFPNTKTKNKLSSLERERERERDGVALQQVILLILFFKKNCFKRFCYHRTNFDMVVLLIVEFIEMQN